MTREDSEEEWEAISEWRHYLLDCAGDFGLHFSEGVCTPENVLGGIVREEIKIALDPSVSSDAQALIDQGKASVNAELLIGKPAMAIGLGIEEDSKVKFIYLNKQIDGGDNLTKGSYKIKFASKDDLISLKLAITELIRIWDWTEEELVDEIQHPKEK